MSIQSLTVRVLSSAVQSEADVFNNLVEVQRLDTMEIGTLLCSHCCRWPAHLVDKATWIEGCYTPSSYEHEARLLMGYHPQTMTLWQYDEKEDGIYVHLTVEAYTGSAYDDDDMDLRPELTIDGALPLTMSRINNRPNHMVGTRTYRHLNRVWREVNRTRQGDEAVLVFFRTVYSMVDNGALDELAVASCIENIPDISRALHEIHALYEVNFNRFRPLSGTPTEVYADGVRVVGQDASSGYVPAISPLNYYEGLVRRRNSCPRAVVNNEAIVWGIPGYALATPLEYFIYDEDEFGDFSGRGHYVVVDVPELGFLKPVDLDSIVQYRDGFGYYVHVCDVDQGYWTAETIH